MSFVDLMLDKRWSDTDINERMRAMRREKYADPEWEFLVQKMLGAFVGLLPGMGALAYTLSEDEQDEIAELAVVLRDVQAAGRAARADMALLARVLDSEQGIAPLAQEDAEGQALLEQRAAARPAPEIDQQEPS